jgi:hypothetical protein
MADRVSPETSVARTDLTSNSSRTAAYRLQASAPASVTMTSFSLPRRPDLISFRRSSFFSA